MNNICIIPARGGSTRIPNKNIKDFKGSPIISYSINTARESGLFDRIIVSTDSKEIADVAREYGAEIHYRSAEMSENEVGTQAVVKNVLEELEIENGLVCCIYATSPLMSTEDLSHAKDVLTYQNDGQLDYAFSVGATPLCDAGQFYMGWAKAFIKEVPLIGDNTAMIPISDDRVCDINTPEDWARAEKMYAVLHEHQYKLIPNDIPELVHFRCDCGHGLPT